METLTLPPFSDLLSDLSSENETSLDDVLSVLFESSPVLKEKLVPQLASTMSSAPPSTRPQSYNALIDTVIATLKSWDAKERGEFIKGYPRCGQAKKSLSAMSAIEQGYSRTAPESQTTEVEMKLFLFNEAYERRYPGLVYITFVNGRSRAMIADEMEAKMQADGILPVAELEKRLDGVEAVQKYGLAWKAEMERATENIGKIAKNRLDKLGEM